MPKLEANVPSFDRKRLNTFWQFLCERQSIWHRRFVQKRPPPWSDDPVFQAERFTNVYRELDPGTQYAITAILERDESVSDRIFNVMLYRLIGRSTTHRAIGFQRIATFDGDHLRRTLNAIRDSGAPPFTAAYMVSGFHNMGSRDKMENVARIFRHLAGEFPALEKEIAGAGHLADVHNALKASPGFGDFLVYQVLVDLLYPLRSHANQPLLPFSPDDWAKAGPGARRGIRLLVPQAQSRDKLPIMRWLRDNQRREFERLGLSFPWVRSEDGDEAPINLANMQNCLCEFHKYVKIRNGTGRGRRKFVPPSTAPWCGCEDRVRRAGRRRHS